MARADEGLAFLLQFHNIAWFENGVVRILDRRVYPGVVRFVECKTYGEVKQAIADMVTQSAGPYVAAGMGMALAAYECRGRTAAEQLALLSGASEALSHARPTTVQRMMRITADCYAAGKKAIEEGRDACQAIFDHTIAVNETRYRRIEGTARHLVSLFPSRGTVLTQCFGETIVGQMLKVAQLENKRLSVVCAETRPYFQGARLTASVANDMGAHTTVITDNMAAWYMKTEHVDVFTSAADVICMDGHVVNKVGTLQLAILAKHFGLPYFVTGSPDWAHPDEKSVEIEMREPEFPLQAMGVRTAAQGVHGWYPSFDVTPPELVSAVVTDRGIFAPYDLHRWFDREDAREETDGYFVPPC